MTAYRLAVYTFGQFVDRADSPALKDFFDIEPSVLAELEAAEGFIARSGYDSDEGPGSWGAQVFPKFWRDNGDGWAPSTLSLWTSPEALAAVTYHGRHGAAYKRGREWNLPAVEWPGYALWWVEADHRPDWREAVERHEHLGDHGPSPKAFTFKQLYRPDGTPSKLDSAKVKELAQRKLVSTGEVPGS
ncbi:DUF3291 domain-containing protein [Roseibium litorale]|uniref:DUF3291 domain-containing protein n=1 Tax=Roseibium litorale TaxID=2803841 RepID=A0ABR9CPV7_9HYPH|nr:DUF3291 domain-containing protein [Roseibium litorale]MBD8892897.1 DUF3291 domain-containing protein [Roseibium litorale]